MSPFFFGGCAGKKRRLQFIECPSDMNAMVDCAKVADLALLLVDASFGFEMVRGTPRQHHAGGAPGLSSCCLPLSEHVVGASRCFKISCMGRHMDRTSAFLDS